MEIETLSDFILRDDIWFTEFKTEIDLSIYIAHKKVPFQSILYRGKMRYLPKKLARDIGDQPINKARAACNKKSFCLIYKK